MELVRCISERKSNPDQITIGKKYWIDYSTAWKDSDGDEYALVYLDEEKKHLVGKLKTSHFQIIYRYLNYGSSLGYYVNSHTSFLLKDIVSWCLRNQEHLIANILLRYIRNNKLDVEENMEKVFEVNRIPYREFAKRGMTDEYKEYMGLFLCCIDCVAPTVCADKTAIKTEGEINAFH